MKLLTLKAAAEYLGVTTGCLRKWHYAGYLDFIKIGPKNEDKFDRDRRLVRIKESDIQKLIEVKKN